MIGRVLFDAEHVFVVQDYEIAATCLLKFHIRMKVQLASMLKMDLTV